MKIAFVSSEVFPFAKTGGLADVAGALPRALAKEGNELKIFMPKYDVIPSQFKLVKREDLSTNFLVRVDAKDREIKIYSSNLPNSNIEVYFIDHPEFFHRGKLYTEDLDEDERFILFQKAVIETIQRMQWAPDIVHCNDWQTGLIPLLIRDNYGWDRLFEKTAILFTIHNIGYQGCYPISTAFKAELDIKHLKPAGPVEFYGKISFLKAGIAMSDLVNTVSHTYSKELLTPEFGHGMEGILEERRQDFFGILNGVDYSAWNPETDAVLPFNYSVDDLSGKLKNKKYLLDELKLEYDEKLPVIGMVSRIVSQKGFDILADAIRYLAELPAQWIILGKGEKRYENKIIRIAKRFPDHIRANLFYNDELAHIIEAGADMFLMPSRYEPCGLNQIYSLKYGTVPIVRKTGGLADTVIDYDESTINGRLGNGFVFEGYNGFELYSAVKRGIQCFKNKKTWNKLVTNGMNENFSWEKSAGEYIKAYQRAFEKRNS